jgi:hypothetical protein
MAVFRALPLSTHPGLKNLMKTARITGEVRVKVRDGKETKVVRVGEDFTVSDPHDVRRLSHDPRFERVDKED